MLLVPSMRAETAAIALGLLGALVLVACGDPPADASAGDDNLIGGDVASDSSLDAVGSLGTISAAGEYRFFCSGTLIAPTVVLTAKHCAVNAGKGTAELKMDKAPVHFAIGADAVHPRRTVRAASVMASPIVDGGFLGLGSDVAIYILSEPITDVRPLKFAPGSLARSDESRSFVAVGYGLEGQETSSTRGRRKAGSVTLRAASGKPFPAIFGSYEAYATFFAELEGAEYIQLWNKELHEYYDYTLLDGYEAWAGVAKGDAQLCNGDSGGPLLSTIGGENVVVGVASSVVVGTKFLCSGGAAYATLGPRVQDLIAGAIDDRCANVPRSGICNGSKLVRCSDPYDTARRIVEVDCSISGGTCGAIDEHGTNDCIY